VRDRILEAAAALFYQEGPRAVGVDLVVERSGVAKTSLYRHFATKDDLIAAVLEQDDANYWKGWDEIAGHESDARVELESHLKSIADHIAEPRYRGCSFLNVATTFAAPGHPARKVAARHKTELRNRLSRLAKRMGIRRPDELADQLVLLIDGAYVNGQLLGEMGPTRALVAAAFTLVSAASRGPV
jgi:AcrR family transcriptional regulator